MTATARRESVVDRILREQRGAQALGRILGRIVPCDKTSAVRCLNPAHKDQNASLIVMPDAARAECRGCGLGAGLLDLAVLAGHAADPAVAAQWLERELFGEGTTFARASGVAAASAADECAPWERYQDAVRSFGWTAAERWNGPALRVPTYGVGGAVGRVKWRGTRDRSNKIRSCFEPGEGVCGLIGEVTALQFGDAGDGIVLLVSGETDALAVRDAADKEGLACWVIAHSAGEGAKLQDLVRVFAGFDVVEISDADAPGRKGVTKRADELRDVARSVRIVEPPRGKDARAFLESGGSLGELLAADSAAVLPSEQRDDGKTTILLRPQMHVVVQESLDALSRDPDLYVHSDRLVHVARYRKDDRSVLDRLDDDPMFRLAQPTWLRERLSMLAEFGTESKRGGWRTVMPPEWVAKTIEARGEWPGLRDVLGIIEAPTMRRDGTILSSPGYDARSGLLYLPNATFPAVPEAPTAADVRHALETLRDPLVDFPFDAEHDLAAALALILTTVARHAYTGNAPLFAVVAATPGSGKTLLVDVVSIVARGRKAPRSALPDDPVETKKVIVSIGCEGTGLVLFDNCEGTIGNTSLASAITGETYSDRLLGSNTQKVTVSLRGMVWTVTGNNLRYRGDLARRVLVCKIDPKMENPEDRDCFKHSSLLDYVASIRPKLVSAALTVLRAYFVAGRPKHDRPALGSFEGWDALIRGALVWAGVGDADGGREGVRAESDEDSEPARVLLMTWHAAFGSTPTPVREAISRAGDDGDLKAALLRVADTRDGSLNSNRIGNALSGMRSRIRDGLRFERSRKPVKGSYRWFVIDTRGGSEAGTSAPGVAVPPAPQEYSADEIEAMFGGAR